MSTPSLTYSKINGVRYVSVDGGKLYPTVNTTAPSGTHDIKTVNGNATIRKGNDLHEPLDVAQAFGKF